MSIAKSAFSFLSGTMLSRITGLVRDMSMAFFFGANAAIAAFIVALRFAILLRRIFGEGALLNGFVPHFESHRKTDPKQAAEFFRDTFFSLGLVLVVLIGFAELVLSFWLPNEIIYLVMLILPGVPFICLFGICSGLLHCEKYFFLSGVAPIAYNLIWIAAVWLFRNELPQTAAVGLSISISLAFFFQWFMTFPKTLAFLRQFLTFKELFAARLFSPSMRTMFTSLSLGVLGVAAAQINTAIDTVFSRFAALEGPAYLNYAIHLQQLPLALFGIGVSSALLPSLSRSFDVKLLYIAITRTMLIILPAAMACFALGAASINLIYGRGDFSNVACIQTTYCLWGYGLGLVPMVLILLLAPAFYAQKNFLTPTLISLLSIGVNLFLNTILILVLHLGPASLAYSTSASALLNAFLLYRSLPSLSLFKSLFTTTLCTLFATIVTLWAGTFIDDPTLPLLFGNPIFSRHFSTQLFQFLILFATFSTAYLFSALLLKRKELYTPIT